MAKDRPKMNKLNRAQKDKVRRFAAVADADEEVALKILKDARWDLEVGLEMFFTAPLANSGSTSPEAVEATERPSPRPHHGAVFWYSAAAAPFA